MTTATPPSPHQELDVVGLLLRRQQELPAVERFARWCDERQPDRTERYRDLIPLSLPAEGEQYAFEVDLDACSGCKACVTACHNLNGLEEDENWRSVGLLHGGSGELPIMQHVTTACHHCLEPGCLAGCPVAAYEKDPVTGIVRHLDDQCIGCRYCMLTCPYDVPQFSRSKGIVRKCDMCSQRLAAGEAPACVQACPNEAIRIRTVRRDETIRACETGQFLPAAPAPEKTLPSTIYKSRRPLARGLVPADYWRARRQDGHLPLIVMLVLTQWSVGAFVVEQVFGVLAVSSDGGPAARACHLAAALLFALVGMAASVLHLGRPLYAFRAVIGLRTSWLSREILVFGLFAGVAALYVAAACLAAWGIGVPRWLESSLGIAAAALGAGGVFCSVMIYVVTGRPLWGFPATALRFAGSALILGLPTALLVALVSQLFTNGEAEQLMARGGAALCQTLLAASGAKLAMEASLLMPLRSKRQSPQRRAALLLAGELGTLTVLRFFAGAIGGLLLPGILCLESAFAPGGFSPAFVGVVAGLSLILSAAGELAERYLFFTTSVTPRMPGAIAA